MKLIQCKLGAVEPLVGGRPYPFTRDQYGRFVARVDDDRHAAILLAVEHYFEAPEIPTDAAAQPAPQAEPPLVPATPEPTNPAPPTPTDAPAFVDDIGLVKGIGPTVKTKLETIGFASLQQIADLTDEDVARLDAQLDLKGGITRFDWRAQAVAILKAAQPAPQA